MTISCWRWLKTAINGGNLWSAAPQSKDDDDDDDDELTGPTQGSLSHIDSLDILIHLTCCQDERANKRTTLFQTYSKSIILFRKKKKKKKKRKNNAVLLGL